jgi:hypothetical protein
MLRTVLIRGAGALAAGAAAGFALSPAHSKERASLYDLTQDISERLARMEKQQPKGNKVDVVLGAQWGDEGKGKLVDCLGQDYDICARVSHMFVPAPKRAAHWAVGCCCRLLAGTTPATPSLRTARSTSSTSSLPES